jgi:probable DNA repair protein
LPDYAAHFALLNEGGELVSATRRQAHELARAYTARQVGAGRTVWETPRIVPWVLWADQAWRALARDSRTDTVLLDSLSATRAWERLVAESAAGRPLLDARAAGRSAAAAWQLAQDWRLDLAGLTPATVEQGAFLGWARTWLQRCTEQQWLDPARLTAALQAEAPRLVRTDERAPVRGPLGFHGFDAVAPARREFMAALQRAGRRTVELQVDVRGRRLATHAAQGPEAELEAIAAWIVARLRADPGARLAVIVPDLASRWTTVRRVMDDRLQPTLLAPGASDERPYAFASGPQLRDYAVVDAALLVLQLARERLDLVKVGRLLRSPYPQGAGTEATRRAALDASLRRAGELQVRVEWLRTLAADERHGCPEFAAAIAAVRRELPADGRRSAAQWAVAMERALLEAGWPEGRTLSSTEYQTARKFHEVIATFGGLERVLPTLTLDQALDELQSVAAEMPFQPESGDAQVLFLDSLTEPGLALDGLWVAGLTADCFPGTAAPNPFLPAGLQRDLRLPHSSAELELDQARRTLAAWQRSAAELVLSWPTRDEDGERTPSPLLPPAPPLEPSEFVPPRAALVRAAARLLDWADAPLPAIAAGEPLRGGVSVLALQAQCAFRAGAEQRLGARPLERPRFGLDPRRRGELAHDALRAFWDVVQSQQRLRALDEDTRLRQVRDAIEQAFARLSSDARRSRMLMLERRWLERAMLALLDVELQRLPFTVVAREQEFRLAVGTRHLEVRIDRIDRLDDGTTVLIDYKTGQGKLEPARWTGTRPDQPQLPAYAAHLPETPAAVAFGRVAIANAGFAGLSAADGVLPGVRTTSTYRHGALRDRPWDSLIEEWRRVTVDLLEAHARGVADVDPAEGACKYCELGGLCRVEERVAIDDADEADGVGAGTADGD